MEVGARRAGLLADEDKKPRFPQSAKRLQTRNSRAQTQRALGKPLPGTPGGGRGRKPVTQAHVPLSFAPHPPWSGESMGFAHSRCNSITALITISISRPDCLLICGKHMSGEVHIPDSARLPKVQSRGGGAGEGRAPDFLLHPLALSSAVNYEDPPLSGIWRLYTFLNIVSQSLQIFTLK